MTDLSRYQLTQLQTLEAEAIHIIREVAAEFERPVLLFSGGKDSIVMLRLAREGVLPGQDPVPGHARRHRAQLPGGPGLPRQADQGAGHPAHRGQRARTRSSAGFVHELPDGTRNRIQTPVLLDALEKHRFTAVFGGARRDEDKARAKERIYSLPRRVRPVGPQEPAARALEHLQRQDPPGREHPGLPAVELDRARHLGVHQGREHRAAVDLLRARARGVRPRTGCCSRTTSSLAPRPARSSSPRKVRYRTVGDASLTAAVLSRRRHGRQGHRGGRGRPGSPSAARPAVTTSSAKPPWKTANARGISKSWTFSGSPLPARVDDGKSTLIGRLLYDTKTVFEDQIESVERASKDRGDDVRQPRPADRRPARRARAGHHDRCRLPLLRHAQAQVHHRGHAGAHPVHPQHGDRCVDRRPRPGAGRRAQGHHRAEPAALLPGDAARGAAPGAVHQQDGPGRLRRGRLQPDPRGVQGVRHQAADPRPGGHPGLGAQGRQRRTPLGATCPGTTGRACCTTWRTSTWPATAT